jgi:hypothetical protein
MEDILYFEAARDVGWHELERAPWSLGERAVAEIGRR